MIRLFILWFLFIINTKAISQNSKLNIEFNIPKAIGNNFLGKNYVGIANIGIRYNLLNSKKLTYSISSNFDFLLFNSISLVKGLSFKPRINAELNLKKNIPYAGIGYSYFMFFSKSNNYIDSDNTTDGINFNIGCKVPIDSKFYVNSTYDFIKFRTENVTNNPFNRNIHILGIGFGLNI